MAMEIKELLPGMSFAALINIIKSNDLNEDDLNFIIDFVADNTFPHSQKSITDNVNNGLVCYTRSWKEEILQAIVAKEAISSITLQNIVRNTFSKSTIFQVIHHKNRNNDVLREIIHNLDRKEETKQEGTFGFVPGVKAEIIQEISDVTMAEKTPVTINEKSTVFSKSTFCASVKNLIMAEKSTVTMNEKSPITIRELLPGMSFATLINIIKSKELNEDELNFIIDFVADNTFPHSQKSITDNVNNGLVCYTHSWKEEILQAIVAKEEISPRTLQNIVRNAFKKSTIFQAIHHKNSNNDVLREVMQNLDRKEGNEQEGIFVFIPGVKAEIIQEIGDFIVAEKSTVTNDEKLPVFSKSTFCASVKNLIRKRIHKADSKN